MAQINIKDAIINVVEKYLTSFGKSLITKFYTKNSVDGKIDAVTTLATHDNRKVLDSLSKDEVSGNLMFEGKPISTAGSVASITVCGDAICGEAVCGFDLIDLSNYYTAEQVDQKVFTASNSAKVLVESAIGDSSISTNNTFAEISDSIFLKKQEVVDALSFFNISYLTKYNDISSYAEAIKTIKTDNTIKSTKLNMKAGETHQEVLSNPITVFQLATSVIKYITGPTGVVNYSCTFDNTDSSNFDYPDTVVFDGSMHLSDKADTYNYSKSTQLENGVLNIQDIDISKFNTVDNINAMNLDYTIKGTNPSAVVKASGDIDITDVLNINKINWKGDISGGGILKLAISFNSGAAWLYYDGAAWNTFDIDIDFKANGMTPDMVNNLDKTILESARNNSDKIRFAYYIEKQNIDDVANNNDIEIIVDMNGTNAIAPQSDFSYTLESDNKTITYTINNSGTYTFVYADKV